MTKKDIFHNKSVQFKVRFQTVLIITNIIDLNVLNAITSLFLLIMNASNARICLKDVFIVMTLRYVKNVMLDGSFLRMELASTLSVLFEMKIPMNVLFANLDIIMFGTDRTKTAIPQSSQLIMAESNMTLILFQIPTFENAKKEKNTLIERILESAILVLKDQLVKLTVLNARLLIGVLLFIVAHVTMDLNLPYHYTNVLQETVTFFIKMIQQNVPNVKKRNS